VHTLLKLALYCVDGFSFETAREEIFELIFIDFFQVGREIFLKKPGSENCFKLGEVSFYWFSNSGQSDILFDTIDGELHLSVFSYFKIKYLWRLILTFHL